MGRVVTCSLLSLSSSSYRLSESSVSFSRDLDLVPMPVVEYFTFLTPSLTVDGLDDEGAVEVIAEAGGCSPCGSKIWACVSLGSGSIGAVAAALNISALLVYDRQALFNIRVSHEIFIKQNIRGDECKDPPFLSAIPDYLRCVAPVIQRRRPRKRGKRSGVLVRVRAYLRTSCGSSGRRGRAMAGLLSPAFLGPAVPRRRWLYPVAPAVGVPVVDQLFSPATDCLPRPPGSGGRGVDRGNLCVLSRVWSRSSSADLLLRFALINVRSVANKTFILNDFFASRELDFMFMTETWLNVVQVRSRYVGRGVVQASRAGQACDQRQRAEGVEQPGEISTRRANRGRFSFRYKVCLREEEEN
ncbi:RNA-directed DNA polymerase from mobile element jockey-like protein [Labeo rohita]|uniref:RNA-directed DNA polymerase from mobile element jockey-like protein n=1 Tax=Labeo rohita TaxID=84645 RepID=A0A498NXY4_LABRO|nr:RNA-directed DNA polymerase from mobile element jockey-like protein [Labeo rohita]